MAIFKDVKRKMKRFIPKKKPEPELKPTVTTQPIDVREQVKKPEMHPIKDRIMSDAPHPHITFPEKGVTKSIGYEIGGKKYSLTPGEYNALRMELGSWDPKRGTPTPQTEELVALVKEMREKYQITKEYQAEQKKKDIIKAYEEQLGLGAPQMPLVQPEEAVWEEGQTNIGEALREAGIQAGVGLAATAPVAGALALTGVGIPIAAGVAAGGVAGGFIRGVYTSYKREIKEDVSKITSNVGVASKNSRWAMNQYNKGVLKGGISNEQARLYLENDLETLKEGEKRLKAILMSGKMKKSWADAEDDMTNLLNTKAMVEQYLLRLNLPANELEYNPLLEMEEGLSGI